MVEAATSVATTPAAARSRSWGEPRSFANPPIRVTLSAPSGSRPGGPLPGGSGWTAIKAKGAPFMFSFAPELHT